MPAQHRKNIVLFILFLPLVMRTSAMADSEINRYDVQVLVNQIETFDYPVIKAYVTVALGKKNPVLGLSRNSFIVREDRISQGKFQLLSPDLEGISIVLALDTSGSMQNESRLEHAKEAALLFINTLSSLDRCAIITFDDVVQQVCDFSNDKQMLKNAVNALTAQNDTRLFDGIYHGIQILAQQPPGRKALIVLTDGKDEGSALLQDDCVSYAVDENIPIFTAAFGSPEKIIKQPVARIAFLAGGEYFYAEAPEVLLELYSTISERLKSQYVIQFRSILPADGQWHQLRVDVLDKNYVGFGTRNYHLSPVPGWFKWYHVLAGLLIIAALPVYLILRKGQKQEQEWGSIATGNVNVPAEVGREQPSAEINTLYDAAKPALSRTIMMNRNVAASISAPAKLVAKLADGQGWAYRLEKHTTTVGSDPDNELLLTGLKVAPHHAVIEYGDDQYVLRALKSEHGVAINNKKVKEKILKNNDIIEIGEILLKFEK